MFRANNFDKLLDKATSNLRLDPDWPTILQICDLIRQNDCTAKYAVAAIKKKLYSQNPHQAMFALLTLESVVKNCGSGIHDEVASKVFCEMLRDLVKTTQHENLRTKILELIQAWGFAFRNNPKYRAVQDTVNILKAEGYKFPPLKESDAMFSADTAPEWADGEVCHRCRVAFSLMVRRHHCRACGQVFCQQCSSKSSTLPKFGIEKEVRVCDACYDKVSRPPSSAAKLEIVDTASDYGPAAQPQKRPGKSEQDLQEEEELQLALALSQSEAEQKEKERSRSRSLIAPDPTPHPTVSPTPSSVSASPEHGAQSSAELSRYLDRNYWEQRLSRDQTAPTAPASHTQSDTSEEYSKPATSKTQEDENEDKEIDEFVEKLKSQVEIFVNRMKSNSSRGRSIANDTSVQSLFMNITAMHSQLLRYIQQQDDKRVYLESLQDKINQIRDSRAALDTLRAEHAARLAAAAEQAERQRQMQMAAKLQAMRKKKHEYLQYQRQLALQRVQEQEREMQMRQEQQKHQYMMASGTGFYIPPGSMQQFQPGFPNQSMYASPQFHSQMMGQATTDGSMALPGQPQITQANMPLNTNQIAALAQSMPQLTNSYPIQTTGMTMSQAPMTTQQSMNPLNTRTTMSQQMPTQQQMMMHQMRMSSMPGAHQLFPLMNVPQQNGQSQPTKQNLPQQQPPTSMMASMSMGQPQLTQANPMLGMQMPNMRLPMMQGQNPAASTYQLNQPNNQLQAQTNMQPQILGQPMSLPGQQIMQGPNQSMPNNNQNIQQMQPSHNQQMPQGMQGQPMSMPGQSMQPPGPQMSMQGPHMHSQAQQSLPAQGQSRINASGQTPIHLGQLGQQNPQMMQVPQQMGQMPQQMAQLQQVPPGQQMPPGQQLPPGQQMPLGQQMPSGQQMPPVQQMPPGQQMPLGQQMPPGQQMPLGQQMPPGQQMPSGQQMPPVKMPDNITNGQSAPQPPPNQNQVATQSQQAQTSVKSEHNNNTAELISFD